MRTTIFLLFEFHFLRKRKGRKRNKLSNDRSNDRSIDSSRVAFNCEPLPVKCDTSRTIKIDHAHDRLTVTRARASASLLNIDIL